VKLVLTRIIFLIIIVLVGHRLNAQMYQFNTSKEVAIIAGSAILFAGSYIIDNNASAITEGDIFALNPANINSFDRRAIYNYNLDSHKYSNYIKNGAFLLPLSTLVLKPVRSEWKAISLMYFETLMLNTSINSFTKSSVTRYRPYTYNQDVSMEDKLTKEADRSFFSGHVSHVASLSFFTASVLNDFYPDSKLKWVWWTGAVTLPMVTGYFRYDAGKHFPTDIIVGYATGALIGYFIPKIHKTKQDKLNITMSPSAFNGTTINLKYTF